MEQLPAYKIFPLGDAALIIDFGNIIDESINKLVHAVFYQLQKDPIPGMIEAVPAYCSLTIYYDVLLIRKKINGQRTAFEWIVEKVKEYLSRERIEVKDNGVLIRIPVCYEKEYGTDLDFIALLNQITIEEIVHFHTSTIYRVYMLGFLPGFAYMGMVDEKIAAPRKQFPAPVEAGAIGIAGRQTGIYPLRSPGGWQIIGRTPLNLFDKEKENPTLFKSGDTVQFYSITKNEFENSKSGNA
ncbi:MAG TPA: 5-oxoprolinase subunit PxpB [Chitinophagaceae bacterium]|jgi:inhibitor of KinA|nr:5-oxoprolinase subunit PxpB [Chitinophagaceae bacterium]